MSKQPHKCGSVARRLTDFLVSVKAEVTSSNTVGYSKVNLSNGYTCIAPAFFTVGQDTIDISAMEDVDGVDGDNLTLLDSTGNTLACYYWWNAYGQWPAMWTSDSEGDEEVTDVSFDQMEGFLFYSSGSAAKLKHWGEVLEDDVAGVELNNGYTTLGNPYNKALPLENLVLVDGVDGDNLTQLDSTGNTLACYYWWNAYGQWPAMWTSDSEGDEEAVGVTLDPSEAFLLYSSGSAATLNVDAP